MLSPEQESSYLSSYEELLKGIKTEFENTLASWTSADIPESKTVATRNVTVEDWNKLVTLLAQTRLYVQALYPVISGYVNLGNKLDAEVTTKVNDTLASFKSELDAKIDAHVDVTDSHQETLETHEDELQALSSRLDDANATDRELADAIVEVDEKANSKVQFRPDHGNAVYANSSGIGSDVHQIMIKYSQTLDPNTIACRDKRGTFRIAHPQDDPAESYTASIDHEPVTVGYFKKNMSNSKYLATSAKNGLLSAHQCGLLETLEGLIGDDTNGYINNLVELYNVLKGLDDDADLALLLRDMQSEIDNKVTTSDSQYVIYGRDASEEQAFPYSTSATKNSMAMRTAQGTIRTNTPSNGYDAVNLDYFNNKVGDHLEGLGFLKLLYESLGQGSTTDKYVNTVSELVTFLKNIPIAKYPSLATALSNFDTQLADKAPKMTKAQSVYTLNSAGNFSQREYTSSAVAYTMPNRNAGGTFGVGTPTADSHPVTRKYFQDNTVGLIPSIGSGVARGLMTSAQYQDFETIKAYFNDANTGTTLATIRAVLDAFVNNQEGTNVANSIAQRVLHTDVYGVYGTKTVDGKYVDEKFSVSQGATAETLALRDSKGYLYGGQTSDESPDSALASVSHVVRNSSKQYLTETIGMATGSQDGLMSTSQVTYLDSLPKIFENLNSQIQDLQRQILDLQQ